MTRYLTESEAEHWRTISGKLREIERLISDAQRILIADLGVMDGKPKDTLDRIESAVSGFAYMFCPQPEWLGGDAEANHYKLRPPHIAGE